ncbi:TPA: mannose-1-phosphate guanylyltransferase/mannose-6-phosphate isomerase [Escherichia coli]|nr:mannose-1-phosphate guanylyltransferase/mannose-6-phosphate isomerase [Escherichia coli]
MLEKNLKNTSDVILPVILAGGSGSRLWPLSSELYPKQFLQLYGDVTMLQSTIQRLEGLPCLPPQIICNKNHRFIVAEQLRQIGTLKYNIIVEPEGRNTAPAIALSAFIARANGQDPLLLVLSADHIIKNKINFHQTINSAIPYADYGKLVTFGIVATNPETGYGYIKRGQKYNLRITSINNSVLAYKVQSFTEKPDLDTAKKYIDAGCYYWNSGMFLFRASKYLHELNSFRPDIYNCCKKAVVDAQKQNDMEFIHIESNSFMKSPADSIDYAIMEKTNDSIVVPMDVGWSDVGSWSSLWDISHKDEYGNVNFGDVINHDSFNNYILADNCLITTIGLKNTVVIQTKDAILIAEKDKVQQVKDIVEKIKRNRRGEYRDIS